MENKVIFVWNMKDIIGISILVIFALFISVLFFVDWIKRKFKK